MELTLGTLAFAFVSCVALVGLQVAMYRRELGKPNTSASSDALVSHVPSLKRAWITTVALQAITGSWGVFFLHAFLLGIFAYGYYHFLNMCRTARRVRLLTEMIEAGGRLDESALVAAYSAREMVDRRLFRLQESGQAVESDGVWHLQRMELVRSARLMRALKKAFTSNRA